MFHFPYIVGPVMGGIIGYITNALAIRMLFRPYNAKYLLGKRLPFTPGIIPKEKGRIAVAIGGAISENLMNREVLEKNLLSDEVTGKISNAITDFYNQQSHNPESLHDFLRHFLSEKELSDIVESVKEEMGKQVSLKLGETVLGEKIADAVVEHVSAKLRIEGLDIPFSSLLGKFGSIWGHLADAVQAPLKNYLAKNINQMLSDKGPEIVNGLLESEIDTFLATPMERLLENREEEARQVKEMILSLYHRMITHQLPKILATVNIPQIIEGRINEMDMRETEQLIFKVMDKELKAIIWLGAILGTIMGTVNAFI